MGTMDDWKKEAEYVDIDISEAKFILIGDVSETNQNIFGIIAKAKDEITAWKYKKIINSYNGCEVIVKEAAQNIINEVYNEIDRIATEQKQKEKKYIIEKEKFDKNHKAKVYRFPKR